MKRAIAAIAIAVACALAAEGAPAAEAPAAPGWNLAELYPDTAAWQREYDAASADLKAMDKWKGQLGKSAAALADASEASSALQKRIARLYVYAQLLSDQDKRDAANLARLSQARQLYARVGEDTAWMSPELLAVGEKKVEQFIRREPRLAVHAVSLRDVLRGAPHTLDAAGERILLAAQLPLAGASQIYNQMSASDIPWPTLRVDGKEVRIDNQGYTLHRQNPDREVRKEVFQKFFGSWKQYESALGQTLATQVQGSVFTARMRNFASAREAALFNNALPVAVYDRLIEQAHEGLPVLARYFRLRARMLGVDRIAYHDIYPEMVRLEVQPRFDIEASKRMSREALAPLGPEYIAALDRGFAGGWMDASPREGKAPGAYVFGAAYDVHPYVFLNHQDTAESLSTFAHEWGHAVHYLLTVASQPWETAQIAIFTTEMASTINSVLLQQYLERKAASDEERLYYLAQELETYRSTFFRQAMFGEFEARIHAIAEKGEALSGERFTKEYGELLRLYHGADQGVMEIDPLYALEWAYIPHFYRNFYVFQYATSVTASAAFAARLTGPDAQAAQRDVIGMLKKGNAEYPYPMFVQAGVDLAQPAPYRALFDRMNTIMDEMEKLLAKKSG